MDRQKCIREGVSYFVEGFGGTLGITEDYFNLVYEPPTAPAPNISKYWEATGRYLKTATADHEKHKKLARK